MTRKLLALSGFCLALSIAHAQSAPALFFSDLSSGPKSGGENNKGVYVTVWGKGFGATRGASAVNIGGGTADNYPVWSDSKITFQIGSVPGSGATTISVTTAAGTSGTLPFTIRTGNIYCVSTAGSDSNSGAFGSCWRTLPKAVTSVSAGATIYVQSGVSQTTDDGTGWKAALSIDGTHDGTSGNPIALVAYPAATVTVGAINGPTYGIRAHDGVNYWVIAGLVVRGLNVAFSEAGSYFWAVGNDISCSNPGGIQGGCSQFLGSDHIYFYGNTVHNISGNNSKQGHAVYFGTDTSHVWAGWNTLANNNTCYGMQFHSSPIGSGTGNDTFDLHVFNNLFHGDGCAGLNFATVDPSKGTVEAYNNIFYSLGDGSAGDSGGAFACLYAPGIVNAGSAPSGTVDIYNNSFYNCGLTSGNWRGAMILYPGSAPALTYRLRNNVVYSANSSQSYFAGGAPVTCGRMNDWYGNGGVPSGCSGDLNVNPGFVSTSTPDFHPSSASSPLVNAGVTISGASTDFDGVTRPQGAAYDIGAYEFFLGSIPPVTTSNLCDVNGDGSVNQSDYTAAINQVLQASCPSAVGTCNVSYVQRVSNAVQGQTCTVGQ